MVIKRKLKMRWEAKLLAEETGEAGAKDDGVSGDDGTKEGADETSRVDKVLDDAGAGDSSSSDDD